MESKKSKILKFFSIIGTIGFIVAMFFIGFFIGAYRVEDDKKIVAFADVGDTEYEWNFISFPNVGGNGLGNNVWNDGTNVYYSYSPSSYSRNHYVLDVSTLTWSQKTWSGFNNFSGPNVWTDGTNIYLSSSSNQYVLDKSTSTWSAKTWNYLTTFNGSNVWTDGTNIYYSSSSLHYVLDVSTSTWSDKIWNGLTSFNGSNVWTDGSNIYYSTGTSQYVLDKSTSTWSAKTWNGVSALYGAYVWTDGTNIYYSYQPDGQYVLDKSTSTWSVSSFPLVDSSGYYYFSDLNGGLYYLNTAFFKLEPVTSGGGSVEPQPNPGSDTLITYFSSSRIPINVDGLVYNRDAQIHTYIAPPYVGNAYFQFDAWTNIGEDEDLFMIQAELDVPGMYGANIQFYGLSFALEDSYGSKEYSVVGTGSEVPYITGSFDYNDNSNYKFWVEVSWSNLDNVNFQRVTFTSSVDDTDKIVSDSILCYVDSDTYLEFTFRHYFAGNTAIVNDPNVLYAKGWGNRTYWLSTSFDNDSLYQSGYDAGYSNGVTAGSNSGYNSGYATGRGEGYNIGYGAGYNAGASDSQYTFLSLIGAVFDAPVQGFQGLFNFNVLGINMKDFLLGLFSIAIVITVIKFVLIK